jgi:hypothetical protein
VGAGGGWALSSWPPLPDFGTTSFKDPKGIMHIDSTKGVWSVHLLQPIKFHIDNHKHLKATTNVKQ